LNPGIDLDFYGQSPLTAKSVQSLADDGRLFLPAQDEKVLKFEWLFRYDTFDPFPPNIEWEYLRSALLPNLSSLDHIATANNFDPLVPGRYATWMDVLSEANSETLNYLLNLMAVSVVENVNQAQPYGVGFDQRPTLPRARWVPCGIAVQDGQQALAAVILAEESQSEVVWLETTTTTIHTDCNSDQIAKIELSTLHPGEKVIDIETESAGYLVLADVWYPGWRAWLDGRTVAIWQANYLFQAIEIPSGKHHLVLAYQPVWFQVGLAISILAGIGVAGLVIYMRRFST
jgi:hypothetical protein